jgi:hypothetical protein
LPAALVALYRDVLTTGKQIEFLSAVFGVCFRMIK